MDCVAILLEVCLPEFKLIFLWFVVVRNAVVGVYVSPFQNVAPLYYLKNSFFEKD
jgi:hypothetical protein